MGFRQKIRELVSSSVFMRQANGWLVWFWLANFPPVIYAYFFLPDVWKQASILYLALVSIYANVAGHWAGWQAARTEVKQEHAAEDVVEELVDKTNIVLDEVQSEDK